MQIAVLISVQPDGGTIKPYVTVDVSISSAVDVAYQVPKDAYIDFSAVSGSQVTGSRLDVWA